MAKELYVIESGTTDLKKHFGKWERAGLFYGTFDRFFQKSEHTAAMFGCCASFVISFSDLSMRHRRGRIITTMFIGTADDMHILWKNFTTNLKTILL